MLEKVIRELKEYNLKAINNIIAEEGEYERNTYARGMKAGIEECIREIERMKKAGQH